MTIENEKKGLEDPDIVARRIRASFPTLPRDALLPNVPVKIPAYNAMNVKIESDLADEKANTNQSIALP